MKESELAALSERLPLDDGELPPGVSTKEAEQAIGLLLAEARRLVAYGKDRGKDWWWLVSNMLVLDGKTELASELVPYDESHSIGEWRGSLSKWDGHHGVFLEVHTAILVLHGADRRIRQSEGGKKGGPRGKRIPEEIKGDVLEWFLDYGYKHGESKREALLYLIETWDDFCRDNGIESDTQAPALSTLFDWVKSENHIKDKAMSR